MNNISQSQIEYLNSPITVLKGIGPKKAQLFSRLGINTIWDLVYYFPGSYDDRRKVCMLRECIPGELCCVKVRPIRQIIERKIKPKLSIFLLYASDGYDTVTIKWFSAPFSKPKVLSGHEYTVYGQMREIGGKKEFEMRYMEDSENPRYTEAIIPIYPATSGLSSKVISEAVTMALESVNALSDCLPEQITKKYSLMNLLDAVKTLHRPDDFHNLKAAHDRLAFEELFVLTLALSFIKKRRVDKSGITINATSHVREFASRLPFILTDGQKQTINDICSDLKSQKPMNRLVQGDVGCGKTAVAAAILYATAKSGYQSAFMAPTEILANQHYNTLTSLLGSEVRIALFTSSVKGKARLSEAIAKGEYDIVVGTHALIEGKLQFSNLALCITDEQHRFGVNQRAMLSSKGISPHVLVMSATPIPRTLSLILYGDLDISVIKSMPKGRQTIETYHILPNIRERAYGFVRKEVSLGHQCYVVCPLVEDSEAIEASSVEQTISVLRTGALRGLSVECVHGKMKADEKDEIMNRFKNNEINVLVSTTVIEVGVDVPNATVMLIENAERFGLSQLHQLRGRVGRGDYKSYCILVSDCTTDNCRERMKIMTETTDGFEISQKDLELRGSGQFFGTRQHGVPELKVANLFSDAHLLQNAVESAKEIIQADAALSSPELANIRGRIDALFAEFDGYDIFN
ncbi:MAG: ATP-dependent DNA helicase RecG [Ruminococcaceae bacterium]|nr:ATP-dependent DNA helicase RecG [Oscillospiraceae bacterium]